jgi:hypothetical protein
MRRFKPKLTRQQLRIIQDRNPDSPEIRALLWEIARLRALIVRADQLQRSVGTLAGGPAIVLEALREELEEEPCLAEFPRLPE